MKKHKEFNLRFETISSLSGREIKLCEQEKVTTDSFYLSSILSRLSLVECEGLLEEIENAEQGKFFEQYFSMDAALASDDDGIEIAPPNVIFSTHVSISFEDSKTLINEWMDYLK